MSGQDRFSYHQSEEFNGVYNKQPSVPGAPYVLCFFVVGVLMMGIGTFITTHAMGDHPEDITYVVVGGVLISVGGLFLFGSVIICIIACCRNSRVQEAFSDELLNIGSSTFYGGRGFAYLVNEDQLTSSHQLHLVGKDGHENLAGPHPQPSRNSESEAVIFLAKTVAQERSRQRKYSKRHVDAANNPCNCNDPSCNHHYDPIDPNHGLNGEIIRANLDHLGLENLRRADPYPELAKDFDLGEGPLPQTRDRSASVYNRQHSAAAGSVPHRLRRNVTYSAASRARIQAKKQNQSFVMKQQPQQHDLPVMSSPHWRKGSLQRKKKSSDAGAQQDVIKIHQLPTYDPALLNALGITPASRDASGSDCNSDRQNYLPENTHGSLRHPRRRPSMALGVRGLRAPQPSGSAYRHRSSIYASDMSLHQAKDFGTRRQESIAEVVYKQDVDGADGASREMVDEEADGSHLQVHNSSPLISGSNPEIDLPRGPSKKRKQKKKKVKKTWSSPGGGAASISSSSSRYRMEANQHSTPPRSSSSSNCSCRSERCSDDSCSDCDQDKSAKSHEDGGHISRL